MHLATLYNPQIVNSIRHISGEVYINRVIPILIAIGLVLCAIAFIILLIIGGVKYITSGGDRARLEGARSAIGNAIIGIIILLLLWFTLQILNLIFGVNFGDIGVPMAPPIPTRVPTVGVPPVPTTYTCAYCMELPLCYDGGGTCTGSGTCPIMVNPCCCEYGGATPTPTPGVPTPTPGSYIYLNVSSGLNCNSVCMSHGASCMGSGTDPGGTNNRTVIWGIAGMCSIRYSLINRCTLVAANTGHLCNDPSGAGADPNEYHNTEWNYCSCIPYPPD